MSAVISPCGKYRYLLRRQVCTQQRLDEFKDVRNRSARGILFVMLNPSVADATEDDATIRRCIDFAQRERMDYLEVVNLYAFRATKPADLWKQKSRRGPENLNYIEEAAERASKIVVAWGANACKGATVNETVRALAMGGRPLYCLGLTKDGQPRHPLFVKRERSLEAFEP